MKSTWSFSSSALQEAELQRQKSNKCPVINKVQRSGLSLSSSLSGKLLGDTGLEVEVEESARTVLPTEAIALFQTTRLQEVVKFTKEEKSMRLSIWECIILWANTTQHHCAKHPVMTQQDCGLSAPSALSSVLLSQLPFSSIHLHAPQTGQIVYGYLARCCKDTISCKKKEVAFWMEFIHFVQLFLGGRKFHKKCMKVGSRCHIEYASSCRDIGAQKLQRGLGTYSELNSKNVWAGVNMCVCVCVEKWRVMGVEEALKCLWNAASTGHSMTKTPEQCVR